MTLIFSFCCIAITIFLLLALFARRSSPTHAGGIVFKNENGRTLFLIVTSSTQKNKWVLPKGRIEENETAEFAAVREVMEETGVAAKPVKRVGIIRFSKKGRQVAVVYFLMEFRHFYNTSTENRQLMWLAKKDAMKKLHPGTAKILAGL